MEILRRQVCRYHLTTTTESEKYIVIVKRHYVILYTRCKKKNTEHNKRLKENVYEFINIYKHVYVSATSFMVTVPQINAIISIKSTDLQLKTRINYILHMNKGASFTFVNIASIVIFMKDFLF